MYQLLANTSLGAASGIKRIADNAFIPFDPANTDYAEYLKWLAEGNTPQPADAPFCIVLTPEVAMVEAVLEPVALVVTTSNSPT